MATKEMTMTVTQELPLLVVADGADTACPAKATNSATYTVGDRVQVTVRTPQQPLVTGRVSA